MSKLYKPTIFFLLIILFFFLQEVQVRNDLFFLHAEDFSRVGRKVYYLATAYIPKEAPIVSLPIKFHTQEHSLSCEIASLKMILDYRGLEVSESELLKYLPFSDRGPRKGDIWGDPDVGFVGDIDGSMPKNTGYGVYEKPLKELSYSWRRADIISNQPFKRLIIELDRGNPVIVWGAVGSGNDNSWYTPEGKYIKAIKGAHVRVLKGYVGSRFNPTHVILMDPIYGELRWSTEKFIANWGKLGNRALVIY